MNIFLDTEFNGFGGDLISLALVADDGREFYEVLPCMEPTPWVKKHVIPALGREPLGPEIFSARLSMAWKLGKFFKGFTEDLIIVADWPEDLAHFFAATTNRHGQSVVLCDLTARLLVNMPPIALTSTVPHNALADAHALKLCYYEAYLK